MAAAGQRTPSPNQVSALPIAVSPTIRRDQICRALLASVVTGPHYRRFAIFSTILALSDLQQVVACAQRELGVAREAW
jgi:hypothetical protein